MLSTKVCIIGSGPAGSTASLYLSKLQIPHILIERKQFPRDKVCGDCFDGRVINLLNDIDESILPEMYTTEIIQDIRLHSYFNSKKDFFSVQIPETQKPRISTRRSEFDLYLQNLAKSKLFCSFIENENVLNIERKNNLAYVQTNLQTVEASIVMIAAGANSPLISKLFTQNINGGHFTLAARAYFKNVKSDFSQSSLRVHLIKKPVESYLYFVDLPKGLTNVELFILKKEALKNNINPERLLQELIFHPPFKEYFTNAVQLFDTETTSIGKSFSVTNISEDNVLLIGASAVSVNPLSGLGVGEAMLTAKLAVEQFERCLHANDFSKTLLKEYDTKVFTALKKDKTLGTQADFTVAHLLKMYDVLLGFFGRNKWLEKVIGKALNKI